MASGSSRRISHVTESSWGTPSGTAFQIDRVLPEGGANVDRQAYQSKEMRSDRAIASLRLGLKKPALFLPFEFSYGTQEDFLSSIFMATWVAAKTPITSLTTTVVAGTTNTMAATGIGGTGGSLVSVGDYVKVSGFTGGYTSNNGYFRVTVRAADSITLGQAVNSSGTSLLTAATSQSGITVTSMGYLATGATEKSIAFEEAYTDISVFAEYLGMVAKSFNLRIPQEGIIEGDFNFLGKSIVGPAATTYTVSTVAATTTDPMDGNYATMSLLVDGVPSAIVDSLDINVDNASDYRKAAFQTNPIGIKYGRSNLTGRLGLYFTASTYWTKYLAETSIALAGFLMDPAGSTGYAFDIPTVKLSGMPKLNVTENDIVSNLQWQGLRDSTLSYVNWKIHKLA